MTENVPDWAVDRVSRQFAAEHGGRTAEDAYRVLHRAFARYIAEHEEAPVDPLLIEAREICAQYWDRIGSPVARDIAKDYRNGIHDEDDDRLGPVLEALKRGLELAREAQP